MLEVQKFLIENKNNNPLEKLEKEFGINTCFHPNLPLVILNYDQILSKPKNSEIVRECRALCLNTNDWALCYRAFPRFFNLGEMKDEMDKFDWTNFFVQEKVDGSLFIIKYYDGEWHGHTRGSFGFSNIEFQSFTWLDAALQAMGIKEWKDLDQFLDRTLTYVCELCTIWNKVIAVHKYPTMYLLSVFEGEKELSRGWFQEFRSPIFAFPAEYSFKSLEEIYDYLDQISDPTFEGVVIRDRHNNRWKIKRKEYLALHALRGEGYNIYNPKHLIPFILGNEGDELLTYFPEVKDRYEEAKKKIFEEYATLLELWDKTKEIENQKEFALAIVGKHKFSNLLFSVKKYKEPLNKLWSNSGDLILKVLFK